MDNDLLIETLKEKLAQYSKDLEDGKVVFASQQKEKTNGEVKEEAASKESE